LPEDEKPYENRWFALPAVSLAVFFIALDIGIIGIIAPAEARAASEDGR